MTTNQINQGAVLAVASPEIANQPVDGLQVPSSSSPNSFLLPQATVNACAMDISLAHNTIKQSCDGNSVDNSSSQNVTSARINNSDGTGNEMEINKQATVGTVVTETLTTSVPTVSSSDMDDMRKIMLQISQPKTTEPNETIDSHSNNSRGKRKTSPSSVSRQHQKQRKLSSSSRNRNTTATTNNNNSNNKSDKKKQRKKQNTAPSPPKKDTPAGSRLPTRSSPRIKSILNKSKTINNEESNESSNSNINSNVKNSSSSRRAKSLRSKSRRASQKYGDVRNSNDRNKSNNQNVGYYANSDDSDSNGDDSSYDSDEFYETFYPESSTPVYKHKKSKLLGPLLYKPGFEFSGLLSFIGRVLVVHIPAKYLTMNNEEVVERNVWGDEIYTNDSDLVAVLVHSGLKLKDEPPNHVVVAHLEILPGKEEYKSSTKYGYRTHKWIEPTDVSIKVLKYQLAKEKPKNWATVSHVSELRNTNYRSERKRKRKHKNRKKDTKANEKRLEQETVKNGSHLPTRRSKRKSILTSNNTGNADTQTPKQVPNLTTLASRMVQEQTNNKKKNTSKSSAGRKPKRSRRLTSALRQEISEKLNGIDRWATPVGEVFVHFNLSNEPCFKYSLSAIADRGFEKRYWTSTRLQKFVLYVETETKRYELGWFETQNKMNNEEMEICSSVLERSVGDITNNQQNKEEKVDLESNKSTDTTSQHLDATLPTSSPNTTFNQNIGNPADSHTPNNTDSNTQTTTNPETTPATPESDQPQASQQQPEKKQQQQTQQEVQQQQEKGGEDETAITTATTTPITTTTTTTPTTPTTPTTTTTTNKKQSFYRWGEVKGASGLGKKEMQEAGVPLPGMHITCIEDQLTWKEINWGKDFVVVRGVSYPIRSLFWIKRPSAPFFS